MTSKQEIQCIRAVYEQNGCDLAVGVGDGKIRDMAKTVASLSCGRRAHYGFHKRAVQRAFRHLQ